MEEMMDSPGPLIVSSNERARQTEQILAMSEGPLADFAIEEVSNSWLRCRNEHRVDPHGKAAPQTLTVGEIKVHREPLESLIFTARGEMDHLYAMVRTAGYALLFCNTTGSVVEHRGEVNEARQFAYWGTWLGGVWSESMEGTNGIGTCIAEQRPVTIHRGQHFRARHKNLSCSGAPVFGVDGKMIAVLDVSAIDPTSSERAHGLTGALTTAAARAIEERYFREHFRLHWVIAVAIEETTSTVLLAVDCNQRIVGANRAARRSFALDESGLQAGISLWRLFERDPALFRRRDDADIAAQLVIAGTCETRPAIITGPAGRQSQASTVQHTHPRFGLLASLRDPDPPARAHGGLPPGAMRRILEYIEAHVSENIELSMLATIAGLSLYHFAREFKRSAGLTPHSYLVRKRVERAKDMLARTDYSLTEIALAAGFSDQSHLARHFRHIIGSTPREFRWAQR
jgi:transcriptional regulator of acetoin/glycerol metabolism/AraC-like DNA-binding protein